ncbi:mRNA-binding ribosome synthesis protein nop7 [Coemansia sp. RSA 552]|nr:mRNA-binding ribosome synthesis protein nop7 [Coemansia sp. RSA 552]
MGRLKKKYTEGASRTYITRNRALKKLQLSLADFRRLCILKGIYPVEPRSRKRANRGSGRLATFYYARDIQQISSEPLVARFRQHKIFLRKLQHALGKHDLTKAKTLEKNKPSYTLNHLVIERYPTFPDALRDLDDALCMVFLFATMPTVQRVDGDTVAECKRLANEFMLWVVHARALRKVFLSIKGIYYQADVMGETITWIVPYQFSQRPPDDVDFKVMATFLQFYRTLLGFVSFRLYSAANLTYPPRIDEMLEDSAAGMGSLKIESRRVEDLVQENTQDGDGAEQPEQRDEKAMAKRMGSLGSKIQEIIASEPAYGSVAPTSQDDGDDDDGLAEKSTLFSKHVVFLSREVPRYSLEFVIRAFGGRVGWDRTSGGGSPFAENDRVVTVQIADRPQQGHQFLDRIYVQPQWIYDSVNANRLLDTDEYLVGQKLPPHLSPFVEYKDGDYVPAEASRIAVAKAAGFEGEVVSLRPEDRDQPESETEAEAEDIEGASADEDEPDSDSEDEGSDEEAQAEKQYQKQLLAERAGVPFSEYQQSKSQRKRKQKSEAAADGGKKKKKRSKAEVEEEERQRMAISMLSKKKRKAVNRARDDAYKQAKDAGALKARKAQAAAGAKKKAK